MEGSPHSALFWLQTKTTMLTSIPRAYPLLHMGFLDSNNWPGRRMVAGECGCTAPSPPGRSTSCSTPASVADLPHRAIAAPAASEYNPRVDHPSSIASPGSLPVRYAGLWQPGEGEIKGFLAELFPLGRPHSHTHVRSLVQVPITFVHSTSPSFPSFSVRHHSRSFDILVVITMDRKLDWKASEQRTLERQGLRAKAPVAAQFEDCYQAIHQLCAFLEANCPEPDVVYAVADDCMWRLKKWGDETGASSRALDYALKRSTRPRRQTLSLLQELQSALDHGM
jgi:hypothetical protein